MNLRVRALDFSYEEDGITISNVNVRFDISGENNSFLNGAVNINKEEYSSINSGSIEDLNGVVKAKLKEQIESL